MKKTPQTKLYTCLNCKWIFKTTDPGRGCPQCGTVATGAYRTYKKKAYVYAKTQKPWKEHKLKAYERRLVRDIEAFNSGQTFLWDAELRTGRYLTTVSAATRMQARTLLFHKLRNANNVIFHRWLQDGQITLRRSIK